MGFGVIGRDVVIFGSSNFAAVVRAGQTLVSIYLTLYISKASAAVPGGCFSNRPTTPSPVRYRQFLRLTNIFIMN
jgi:hypothetical protein